MTQITYTITATVDEELLVEHNAANELASGTSGPGAPTESYPLPADPEEYTWDDLKAAVDEEILIDVEVQR